MNSARGLTLVELMITTTILALVMMATLTMYRSGIFAYTKYRERQEQTDQCEVVLAMLAVDLREAAAVEFIEPRRIGMRLPDKAENGWMVPGARVVYEYRPAPEASLLRAVNHEERIIARAIEDMTFAPTADGATVAVSYQGTGMSRIACVLPVGLTFPRVRQNPEAGAGGQP